MTLITVFTPTYNRMENLKKCYMSLLEQTNKNFIWQIVDDGSTDQTEQLVEKWIEKKELNIVYIKKSNGGKASSINVSLGETETPLWLTLDSDDYLFPEAIQIILDHLPKIEGDEKVCGMFALRSKPNGEPMQNQSIPQHVNFATQNYIRYELGIPPEYLHVFKTEVIKKYPYPSIDGENYIPLSYVFDQIDQNYHYFILPHPLMVCEYQEGGITNTKRNIIKKNPKGYTLYKRQLIELAPDFKTKLKASANYLTGCILSRDKQWFNNAPNKGLLLLSIPIGVADYLIRYRLNIAYNPELSYLDK